MKRRKLLGLIFVVISLVLLNCNQIIPAQSKVRHEMVLKVGSPLMVADGVEKEIDPVERVTPFIEGGRALVPARSLVEALGGTISWDAASKGQVIMKLGDKSIEMYVNASIVYVNSGEMSEEKGIDTPMRIVKNRAVVPVRYVFEHLGCEVKWDNAKKQITIGY
ncbi:MAG: stalk domain-containing protein [Bacillota bacterium]